MMRKQDITISGKKMLIRSPAQTVEVELIGNVGDTVIATPSFFGFGPKGKARLPSGEEIIISYVIGKITEITPCPDCYNCKWSVKYKFTAYIDMEDGTKVEFKGSSHVPADSIDNWIISPYVSAAIPKISDYRAYTNFWHERDAAYEAFNKEWEERNPMKINL